MLTVYAGLFKFALSRLLCTQYIGCREWELLAIQHARVLPRCPEEEKREKNSKKKVSKIELFIEKSVFLCDAGQRKTPGHKLLDCTSFLMDFDILINVIFGDQRTVDIGINLFCFAG